MSLGICETCRGIFSGPKRIRQEIPHHQSRDDLQAAAKVCYICRIVNNNIESTTTDDHGPSFTLEAYLTPIKDMESLSTWLRLTIEQIEFKGEAIVSKIASVEKCPEPQSRDSSVSESDSMTGDMKAWGFNISPAEEVAANVGQWAVPSGIHDDELWDLARSWDQHCRSRHAACVPKESEFRPTRLLDTEDPGTGELKLIETMNETDFTGAYATVSHCWGLAKTLKLLSSNRDDLLRKIRACDLPTAYQEAVLAVKKMGIRYIWIDSLCIIQDSREDWLHEASKMGEVYKHSHLNIALAGAADNSEPCFTERDARDIRSVDPIVAHWDGEPIGEYCVFDDMMESDIKNSKLHSRAWVVQEGFLAPRILSLGKSQMWYQCGEGLACETFPGWAPYMLAKSFQPGPLAKRDGYLVWDELVEQYSACSITVLSDRMIAISGIASRFRGDLVDEYIAGLWESQLPAELLWEANGFGKTYRPAEYRAPSWSWCSLEGGVHFEHRPMLADEGSIRLLCDVKQIQVELVDSQNPTGLLKGGFVELKGALHAVVPWYSGHVARFDCDTAAVTLIENSRAVEDYVVGIPAVRWIGDECDDEGNYASAFIREAYGDPDNLCDIQRPDQVGVYFLPVLTFRQDGFPFCRGLLLQEVEGEETTFKRIGTLHAIGEEECSLFPEHHQSVVRIV